MLQLCYLYDIEEIWLLALIFTYVYQLEPKYEKAFLILQGDTGRRAPDVFLVSAFAHYLGIEHSVVDLRREGRVKNELFELQADGQLFLKEYVFLWLNEKENNKLFRQGIFEIYEDDREQSVIRISELERITTIAKRQLEENTEKQLIFELDEWR